MFNKLLVFFMMFFFVLPLAFAAEQEVKGTTQVINPVEIDGITVSSMEDAWEATEDSQEFRDVALEMGYQEEQIDDFIEAEGGLPVWVLASLGVVLVILYLGYTYINKGVGLQEQT